MVVNPTGDRLIGDALEAMLADKLGPRIVENAVRLVPVLSGDTRDSINYEVTRDGERCSLIVGVDQGIRGVDYALFLEDGTSIMAAQPFLRPAVYQAKGVIV